MSSGTEKGNTICGYEVHPAAALFPMMPEAELKELADDIKAHGLIHPIILKGEQILDGRNRLMACKQASVPFRFEYYVGDHSPTEYVIAANLKRRQLTPSQKAAVGAEALPLFEAEAKARQALKANLPEVKKGQARDKAAAAVSVSPRYVQDAKKIKEQSPKLFQQMASGEKTISEAKKELQWEQGVSDVRRPAEHAPEDDDSDNLWNMKRLWRKSTKKEKSEFVKWIQGLGQKLKQGTK